MVGDRMIHLSSPIIGPEERDAVLRVMVSGMLAQGPEVAAFEEEFSAHVDGRPCVAVSAGTTGLHLGMLALGIGPGDEVIVPSFTFAGTANAVRLCGAEPVFVDIEPDHFNIDPAAVAAAITPRTVAVVPVHLYGHPADMTAINALAARHGLLVVEDAAQAHLASWQGTPVGALGDAAMFSFYPTKNMTTGEGGMVVVKDEAVARRLRLLRNQGMEARYANEIVGFNARLTDLGGAIGRAQLRKVEGWTATRKANAKTLDSRLSGVVTPPVAEGASHVYHQYTVRSADRDGLLEHLRGAGIGAGVYYPTPVHRLPSFGLSLDLPETERAAREVLSLPVRPDLTDEELEQVVAAVNSHG
ncbi:UDP-4-amino-4-deoxy-L-arabinose--oxoglutarate aminotransferase [Euzebya pacifica]|uniref:UDP-4-amino-4-deoxy-L-arabinose--oxoglutarate aminotransferase n=2 Tax=Euzebya pacifica TaxID=1608957 RepID=A0A346XW27_9ACTN|nr:UDP-4-amino-4-deoxy-L-arabinose--oxoglutarate aminotransferase [Euzebya pacifica]